MDEPPEKGENGYDDLECTTYPPNVGFVKNAYDINEAVLPCRLIKNQKRVSVDRDYPDRPFVGVGAVIWKDDKVLLVRRDKTPRMGEWSIPGGAQHIGETLEAAVLREVKEETDLTVSIAGMVDVIDGIFLDAEGRVKNHYTLVDYSAAWQSGDAQALDDIAEVRWVTLDELGDYGLWDETERIIRKSAWSPRLARKE